MTSTIIRIKTGTNLCEVAYQLLFPLTGSRDKQLTGKEGSSQGNEAPKSFCAVPPKSSIPVGTYIERVRLL